MPLLSRCIRRLGLFGLFGVLVASALLSACGRHDTGARSVTGPVAPEATGTLQPAVFQQAPATPQLATEAARTHYRNVPVLGELARDEFDRTMQAITAWVSPQAGCEHCHVVSDWASDAKPAKLAARRMLQMVQALNANWKPHLGAAGVTCYTCHQGQPKPTQGWSLQAVGAAAEHPLRAYLRGPAQAGRLPPAQQADAQYSLMLHYNQALATDCAHCHDTPGAAAPTQPLPAKQALRMRTDQGVRLLQALNTDWLADLPGQAHGPQANCATCHQGRTRPGGDGAPRARDHAALTLVPLERDEPASGRVASWGASDRCAQAAANAVRSGQRIPAEAGLQPVLGSAPLALYAAPDAACALLDLPLPHGTTLETFVSHAGYTSVRYRLAATGSEVRGWARSDRLGPGSSAAPMAAATGASTTAAAGLCPNTPPAIDSDAASPASERVRRQVRGSGRLQFYAAPDAGCPLRGIFILPGEPVLAVRQTERFTAVLYVNPRTGGQARGWVLSERLGGG